MTRAFIIYATTTKGTVREQDANRVFNHCKKAVTDIAEQMRQHIDDILVNVTQLLWDRNHCVSLLGEIPLFPEMNKKLISQSDYDKTILYIQVIKIYRSEKLLANMIL